MRPDSASAPRSYDIWDLTEWLVVSQEARGMVRKDWVAHPTHAEDHGQSRWWLFKPNKVASYRRCEDYSEKIAAELARLIGLPAATVELARSTSDVGIISRNVTPDGWSLESGDLALADLPGYVSCAVERPPKNRIGHTLVNVQSVLMPVGAPPSVARVMTGFDVFVGYLVLDAWIANTDRHALNWAVMTNNEDGSRILAPSFDHGSSLASGAQDAHLERTTAQSYAERGTAQRFQDGHSTTLVDLARSAVDMSGGGGAYWLQRLSSLDAVAVEAVIAAVPGMSEVRRSFLRTLLETNRRRLTS